VTFYADLHVHSKYSRATSKQCDPEHLAYWAMRKGIRVIGTGDFTHPAWRAELAEKLVRAEPGLFRLRPDLEREVGAWPSLPPGEPTRFMLSVEISTIYNRAGRTRKVHHVVYAPDLDRADEIARRLAKIGNIASDGRPILGLDSRDLLEIVLESGAGCYLVPAHVWTPWFAVLGSKSGFDDVTECYADLSDHIFALETGLSSDPKMNWRLSKLDRYTLVSNSDAHSPSKLGREACAFECDLDYYAMRRALETGDEYGGTVEFFPEEGKYHLDGHRKCGVVLEPEETRAAGGCCPVCGKPVTVGVMHRVLELADRPPGFQPPGAHPFRSLIPLPEIIAEIARTGAGSKTVARGYDGLLARLGSELHILERAPVEELRRAGSPHLAEAIDRMRRGAVIRKAGFDGEYGAIRLFDDGELKAEKRASLLLDLPAPPASAAPRSTPSRPRARTVRAAPVAEADDAEAAAPAPAAVPSERAAAPTGEFRETSPTLLACEHLAALDRNQRAAAEVEEGPLLIVAGPGTGKTRTLTHRIAHLVACRGVVPESCLAITFTNRAAAEMRERLGALLPDCGDRVPVATFHSLALAILRDEKERLGLPEGFRVAADGERADLLAAALGCTERVALRALRHISLAKRTRTGFEPESELGKAMAAYERVLREQGLVDFDDLMLLCVSLLGTHDDVRERYRERFGWVSVDEYQDLDELQYELVKLLCPRAGNLCAIGDPDQAIYGFRGADVALFLRFREDFPSAREVRLERNYRSSSTIVDASLQAIAPASLVAGRSLSAVMKDATQIEIVENSTERAEAEFVVHGIEQLVGGTSFFSLDSGRTSSSARADYSFADFGVLYRMDAQADALCEALARSGIPHQRRSHGPLSQRPLVPVLTEAVLARTDGGAVVERLRAAADELRGAVGVEGEVEAALDLLLPIAERCGGDAAAFACETSLGSEADAWDPRADRVSLLTLHAAKGLEFRVVFLVGCEDGILPLRWGGDDIATDEERRLFFVGMTRARDRLYLTRARKRMWRGQLRAAEVSPFVRDIEASLLVWRAPRPGKPKPTGQQLVLF